MNHLTGLIEEWAKARGLDAADPNKQALKLTEELGELCQGLVKNKPEQVKDSIGDLYVVLVILSMQLNLPLWECVAHAYDEIKDRTGELRNGVYVKTADLS